VTFKDLQKQVQGEAAQFSLAENLQAKLLRHILRQTMGTDNRKVSSDISNSYKYGEGERLVLKLGSPT
jgi:hypothetical protein